MPFIGLDWRSPGDNWVKVSSGEWVKMDFMRRRLLESICREVILSLQYNISNDPHKENHLETKGPFLYIVLKITKETKIQTSMEEALNKLDICGGVKDQQKFAYICKLLSVMVRHKLGVISGSSQKILINVLVEIVLQGRKTQMNLRIIRELLAEMQVSLEKYKYSHLGSQQLWRNHQLTLDKLKSIHEGISIVERLDDQGKLLHNMPSEILDSIFLKLSDHKDLLNAMLAYGYISKPTYDNLFVLNTDLIPQPFKKDTFIRGVSSGSNKISLSNFNLQGFNCVVGSYQYANLTEIIRSKDRTVSCCLDGLLNNRKSNLENIGEEFVPVSNCDIKKNNSFRVRLSSSESNGKKESITFNKSNDGGTSYNKNGEENDECCSKDENFNKENCINENNVWMLHKRVRYNTDDGKLGHSNNKILEDDEDLDGVVVGENRDYRFRINSLDEKLTNPHSLILRNNNNTQKVLITNKGVIENSNHCSIYVKKIDEIRVVKSESGIEDDLINRNDSVIKRNDNAINRNDSAIKRNDSAIKRNDNVIKRNDNAINRNDSDYDNAISDRDQMVKSNMVCNDLTNSYLMEVDGINKLNPNNNNNKNNNISFQSHSLFALNDIQNNFNNKNTIHNSFNNNNNNNNNNYNNNSDSIAMEDLEETDENIVPEERYYKSLCRYHFGHFKSKWSNVLRKNESMDYLSWAILYSRLVKRFGFKEEYSNMLCLCKHCNALFWNKQGHPCILSSFEPSLKPVTPDLFIELFAN